MCVPHPLGQCWWDPLWVGFTTGKKCSVARGREAEQKGNRYPINVFLLSYFAHIDVRASCSPALHFGSFCPISCVRMCVCVFAFSFYSQSPWPHAVWLLDLHMREFCCLHSIVLPFPLSQISQICTGMLRLNTHIPVLQCDFLSCFLGKLVRLLTVPHSITKALILRGMSFRLWTNC